MIRVLPKLNSLIGMPNPTMIAPIAAARTPVNNKTKDIRASYPAKIQ
jgi:hypothetical protein